MFLTRSKPVEDILKSSLSCLNAFFFSANKACYLFNCIFQVLRKLAKSQVRINPCWQKHNYR